MSSEDITFEQSLLNEFYVNPIHEIHFTKREHSTEDQFMIVEYIKEKKMFMVSFGTIICDESGPNYSIHSVISFTEKFSICGRQNNLYIDSSKVSFSYMSTLETFSRKLIAFVKRIISE